MRSAAQDPTSLVRKEGLKGDGADVEASEGVGRREALCIFGLCQAVYSTESLRKAMNIGVHVIF